MAPFSLSPLGAAAAPPLAPPAAAITAVPTPGPVPLDWPVWCRL